jgi:hypothetical protein
MKANLDDLRKEFVVYRTEEYPRLPRAFKVRARPYSTRAGLNEPLCATARPSESVS